MHLLTVTSCTETFCKANAPLFCVIIGSTIDIFLIWLHIWTNIYVQILHQSDEHHDLKFLPMQHVTNEACNTMQAHLCLSIWHFRSNTMSQGISCNGKLTQFRLIGCISSFTYVHYILTQANITTVGISYQKNSLQ